MDVDIDTLITKFNDEVIKLCAHLDYVIKSEFAEMYQRGKISNVGMKVNAFTRFFLNNQPLPVYRTKNYKRFFACFSAVGDLHRKEFLGWVTSREGILTLNDHWLQDNEIVIDISTTIPGLTPDEKREMRKYVIELSNIYRMSLKLRTRSYDLLEGGSNEVSPLDLNSPFIIALHLTRIYYYLMDAATQQLLGPIINAIEKELGISHHTHESKSSSSNGNFIAKFASTATSFMDSLGYGADKNPLKNIPLDKVNDDNIINTFDNIIKNEKTVEIVSRIMKNQSGEKKDIKSMIGNLTDTITSGNTLSDITSIVTGAVTKTIGGSESPPGVPVEQEVNFDLPDDQESSSH